MNRLLCALAVLPLACVTWTAPAPEPFVTGWGRPVDPDNDCKIRREKGALTIEMPGTAHEYNYHRKCLNAPRLLRDFEGDFEMEVRVRIDCRPSLQSSIKGQSSYVSAGFLVIPPEEFGIAFYRWEYRVGGQGVEAEGCAAMLDQGRESGQGDGIWDKQHPDWPFKARPDYVYLRLERWGELMLSYISPDRKKWVKIGGAHPLGLPSKLKVAFVACSTSTDSSKVQFDELTISKGKKRDPWEFVSGWGHPIDPDKDCKIEREKESLAIEMPGRDHDYDPIRKRFNAPRLLCDLEGTFDLEVRVRIDYHPSAQSTVKGQPSFVSAGFLLIYPETERSICDRLEFAVSQQGSRRDGYAVPPHLFEPRREGPAPQSMEADGYAVWKNWGCEPKEVSRAEKYRQRRENRDEWDRTKLRQYGNSIWERGWQNWPPAMKTDCAYLRLEQREEWSCFFISPDGEKWTPLEYLRSLPAGGKLALAAYSTSTEPSKVIFDRLKLARGKKAER